MGKLSLFQGAPMVFPWRFRGDWDCHPSIVLLWYFHGTTVYLVCFYGASVVTTFSHGALWFLHGASMGILLCLRFPWGVHDASMTCLMEFDGESMA